MDTFYLNKQVLKQSVRKFLEFKQKRLKFQIFRDVRAITTLSFGCYLYFKAITEYLKLLQQLLGQVGQSPYWYILKCYLYNVYLVKQLHFLVFLG